MWRGEKVAIEGDRNDCSELREKEGEGGLIGGLGLLGVRVRF